MEKKPNVQEAEKNLTGNPQALFVGLKNHDPTAIRFLHAKALRYLYAKRQHSSASPEDVEEMANDAVMIALQKISSGAYSYQGHSPTTFTLSVADNLLRNFQRKKLHLHYTLTNIEIPQAPEALAYLTQKELQQKVEKMLSRLSPAGQRIIKLKYYEELKDDEIVERQLTAYRTVDSLKSKRCAYMRVLRKNARLAAEKVA